jgi:hypothetical protein
MEITGLGGADFERAVAAFAAGEPVTYRGVELVLRRAEVECRVPTTDPGRIASARALELLTGARFRIGALLASAPPLEAVIGNRPHRYLLMRGEGADARKLFQLRGDRLRRVNDEPQAPPAP